jgi:intraflagellar transport protein 88
MFDPLKQRGVGPAPPLAEKSDNSPEDLAREMEKQVNALIEASADAALAGDAVQALERAKEAVRACACVRTCVYVCFAW